ncbi:MAG: DNA mismatch repair endonuclease MutL [Halobacteriales archaeon]|nr:DNA mismatch repair endonuclease MutL [Halobacteriales archaeon]
MSIKRLDDDAIRRIAAGEVIERPASVVKELVENALDADASRIDVVVTAGGTELIRVRDNGVGMTLEEAELAVEKHTTSKIEDADDLEQGITTLGFRGEALHAIGSVAKLTITTKPTDGDRASELHVAGGEITDSKPAGRATGTTVEVTDLFYNTPARAKFLKTETTEFDHINRIVTRYALANPDVAISLTHNGNETFATTGSGDRRGAILSVYGREVAESMIPVETENVSGYVSHPETTRSTRDYLSTFVNGRYVTATPLREAILDAYGKQLAADRYPFAVLFIELPPGDIDVNVHPRKLEVRFGNTQAVKDTVESAVEGALLEHGLLRSSAPRGRSAPEETTVEPETERELEPDSEARAPATESGETDETGEAETESASVSAADPTETAPPHETDGEVSTDSTAEPATAERAEPTADDAHEESATAADRRFRSAGTQTTLDAGTASETAEFDQLPAMQLLGQLHETYIVAETDDGLVLIDQHAADERIHYERLQEQLAGEPAVQALAEPVELDLTAREAALFDAYEEALEAIGFRARRIDNRTVAVDAVPAVIAEPLDASLLRDVLSELIDADQNGTAEAAATTSVDERIDAIVSDLACHPAITGNTGLSTGSVQSLVTALDACDNPYACPHGRPTLIRIDHAELDERFERDYPGHDQRRRLE